MKENSIQNQFNTNGETLREVSLACPQYVVIVKSSHSEDSLLSLQKIALDVLSVIKEKQ